MAGQGEPGFDLAGLVVPLAGGLVATGDRWEPYRLVDGDGAVVAAAGAYFGHLQAAGRAELTVRSYGMDLLPWFRPEPRQQFVGVRPQRRRTGIIGEHMV